MSNFILTQSEKKVNEMTRKKMEAKEVAIKMLETGFKTRYARMKTCSDYMELAYCPTCQKYHCISTNLCRDRMCPICQRKLAIKRYQDMCSVFEELNVDENRVSFITLTIRNVYGSQLSKALKNMSEGWNRFARQKIFKITEGWAKSLEITYNKEKRMWHPHLHIIAIWKKGERIPMAYEIKAAWQLACRLNYEVIIDIRDVYSKDEQKNTTHAALEACKYSVKSAKIMNEIDNEEWKKLVIAIGGVRMVSYGKKIKEARAKLRIKDEDEIEEKEIKCKKCGTSLQKEIYRWAGNEYELIESDKSSVATRGGNFTQ